MDFEFSDEQQQLREAVSRCLGARYDFERYRRIKSSAQGWDREVWGALAEIGVPALTVPLECGGLGLGAIETLLVMMECGRHLLLEPVLASAVVATAALRPWQAAAASALLAQLAAGEKIAVLAHHEGARGSTRAQRLGARYRLDGHTGVVLGAPAADVLLISARSTPEEDGGAISLFLVPREAAGLHIDGYPTLDGQRAGDIYLRGVEVEATHRLGPEGGAAAAIAAALDIGLAALCADALGAMQALFEATVAYVKVRHQFGQPLGRFQALQHRIADMLIHLEQARSMTYLAALRCEAPDPLERQRTLSAAKTVVSQAARFIAQQAVQLHGGMGMSDELAASHWFRRLTAADLTRGDADWHLQRFAALSRR